MGRLHYQFGYSVTSQAAPIAAPADSLGVVLKGARNNDEVVQVAIYPKMCLVNEALGAPSFSQHVPDPRCPANKIASSFTRFGRQMPTSTVEADEEFREFVHRLIPVLWPSKVHPDNVLTPGQWLMTADYPPARREALKRVYGTAGRLDRRALRVGGFLKFEGYDKLKIPRTINAPSDETKLLMAAPTKAADELIFHGPHTYNKFVKGTWPGDWPQMLEDTFGIDPVVCTDFTAMESHHFGIKAELVYDTYDYLLSDYFAGLDIGPDLRSLMKYMFLGRRQVDFGNVTIAVDQRLMSGSQWTSGANSLLNFYLVAFIMSKDKGSLDERAVWTRDVFRGKFEGDDGVFSGNGMDAGVIESLGLVLKDEPVSSIHRAGFCGMYMVPHGAERDGGAGYEQHTIIRDPFKTLATFFRIDARHARRGDEYHNTLLRAKAMSYLHIHPGCPVVGPLSERVISITKGLKVSRVLYEFEPHVRAIIRSAMALMGEEDESRTDMPKLGSLSFAQKLSMLRRDGTRKSVRRRKRALAHRSKSSLMLRLASGVSNALRAIGIETAMGVVGANYDECLGQLAEADPVEVVTKYTEISDTARARMEEEFDMTVDQQIEIEDVIKKLGWGGVSFDSTAMLPEHIINSMGTLFTTNPLDQMRGDIFPYEQPNEEFNKACKYGRKQKRRDRALDPLEERVLACSDMFAQFAEEDRHSCLCMPSNS